MSEPADLARREEDPPDRKQEPEEASSFAKIPPQQITEAIERMPPQMREVLR